MGSSFSRLAPAHTRDGALPNVVIIGAMKSGTTALHRYLDRHPDVAMSEPKELNFFFGPADAANAGWHRGNWHRGLRWYAGHFPAAVAVRGESSPGYTSPSHPEVAGRMAATVPDARVLYVVRDPIDRAVSQYHHHHRDGSETRSPDEALVDPASQYVSRSRYYERLEPFVRCFGADQIAVVAHDDLLVDRADTLRRVFAFVGADPSFWVPEYRRLWHTAGGEPVQLSSRTRAAFAAAVADDVGHLRVFAGRDFAGWSV